jgi:hypothetical protein
VGRNVVAVVMATERRVDGSVEGVTLVTFGRNVLGTAGAFGVYFHVKLVLLW